jgi:hypothetical protein
MDLMVDAGPVIRRCVPGAHDVYARLGWRFPASIYRVYDPARVWIAPRLSAFETQAE